jgi:glycosyltransferase involved in cell wall biosynthesis
VIQPRVLAIIPCYNEAANVPSVINEIKGSAGYCDVLVIDDGSTDDTFSVAAKCAPTLRLEANLGIGGCLQTGLKYARRHDYDLCIQVDGDGQHPPSEIERLFQHEAETKADIVVGSRFLRTEGYQSTFLRRGGIALISWALRLLFGSHITDPTSGFRLMNRRAIALFSVDYPLDYPEPISLAHALHNGLTVSETSVKMRARRLGNSSISGLKSVSYVIRVLSYVLLAKLNRRRRDAV